MSCFFSCRLLFIRIASDLLRIGADKHQESANFLLNVGPNFIDKLILAT